MTRYTEKIVVRVDRPLLEAIERYQEQQSATRPDAPYSREAAMRELLRRGLPADLTTRPPERLMDTRRGEVQR